jgi:pantetheine-phosphate adenylyltransferase
MINNKAVKAIYPGTFDPITFGHFDIIKRASNMFAELVVAVAEDCNKQTLFSLEERLKIVQAEVAKIDGNVIVKPFSGLLINFVHQEKGNVIVRGLRALADFEYEFQMFYMNNKMDASIETVFIPATENGHFISSRFVKELARLGGDVKSFVSPLVQENLLMKFRGND